MPKSIAALPNRGSFAQFRKIQTRWMDNDVYGHVNNVTYYSYFDTAVNGWLIEQKLIDRSDPKQPIFIIAETGCSYFASIAYPQLLEVGLALARLGNSSVTYRLGLFVEGEQSARALGKFVHVQVDPVSMRPLPLGEQARTALNTLEIR